MAKMKVVIRVAMCDRKKDRSKAMKIAAAFCGVESVAIKGDNKDQIEVTGEAIDTVELAKLLRKKVGHADLLGVGLDDTEKKAKEKKEKEEKEKKEKEEKEKKEKEMRLMCSAQYPVTCYYGGGVPACQFYHEVRDPDCSIM